MLKKIFDYGENEERRKEKRLELQERMFEQSMKRDRITQYDNYILKEKWKKERFRTLKLLDEIQLEIPRFGKPYLKLEIEESELESLKQALKEEL